MIVTELIYAEIPKCESAKTEVVDRSENPQWSPRNHDVED